jgi:hypothetical protein
MKGYIVLTNQRIVFIQGGGRFNRVFTKGLEANYSEIKYIKIEPGDFMHIKLSGENYTRYLQILDVPAFKMTDVLDKYVDVRYFYEENVVQGIPA